MQQHPFENIPRYAKHWVSLYQIIYSRDVSLCILLLKRSEHEANGEGTYIFQPNRNWIYPGRGRQGPEQCGKASHSHLKNITVDSQHWYLRILFQLWCVQLLWALCKSCNFSTSQLFFGCWPGSEKGWSLKGRQDKKSNRIWLNEAFD